MRFDTGHVIFRSVLFCCLVVTFSLLPAIIIIHGCHTQNVAKTPSEGGQGDSPESPDDLKPLRKLIEALSPNCTFDALITRINRTIFPSELDTIVGGGAELGGIAYYVVSATSHPNWRLEVTTQLRFDEGDEVVMSVFIECRKSEREEWGETGIRWIDPKLEP